MAEPKQGVSFSFRLSLVDALNPEGFLANPPIAAGDFQRSLDGGALANLDTLPVVDPAGSTGVLFTTSIAEMTAQELRIYGKDQTVPTAWQEMEVVFNLPQNIVDDVFDALLNGAIVVNEAGGTRLLTIFEDDGTTVKAQVRISADGLTRTKL